jgi:pimeloyl-ACP methyl ester carboxylesterase
MDTTPWAEVAALANASNASWHSIVTPLALMVKLTYTATWGSYLHPEDLNATVAGWERPLTENPPYGMRALFFVDESTRRGVVAFRGTDLNTSSASGQCDQCADDLLWHGGSAHLPDVCRAFSNESLDYYASAQRFIRRVRRARPDVQLLFTGHSLGAGLAFASAAVAQAEDAEGTVVPAAGARSDAPVVVAIAAPPWLPLVQRRAPHAPLPSPASAQRRFWALADEWDPVQRQSVAQAGLLGTQCLWRSPEPPACTACYAAPHFNQSSLPCIRCFETRHIYAHYLDVDVPGPRARCAPVHS